MGRRSNPATAPDWRSLHGKETADQTRPVAIGRDRFHGAGHRDDPERQRVIYQPVTIEPREITPRIIREDHYGGLA